MYLITHHHNYDEILVGPTNWRPNFFASVIKNDLDLSVAPTILETDESKVPYDILPNVRVRRVVSVTPEINSKIQVLAGPTWSYTPELATATYTAADKDIGEVKSNLKNEVSAIRYGKEVSGFTTTIQGTEVFISTQRDERGIYFQKYLSLADGDTANFKFGQTWLTLTKPDILLIVGYIDSHIQSAFDWEVSKYQAIDACTTLQELDALVFVEV